MSRPNGKSIIVRGKSHRCPDHGTQLRSSTRQNSDPPPVHSPDSHLPLLGVPEPTHVLKTRGAHLLAVIHDGLRADPKVSDNASADHRDRLGHALGERELLHRSRRLIGRPAAVASTPAPATSSSTAATATSSAAIRCQTEAPSGVTPASSPSPSPSPACSYSSSPGPAFIRSQHSLDSILSLLGDPEALQTRPTGTYKSSVGAFF